MRNILFRGKTIDTKEWIDGSYIYAHKWNWDGSAGHLICDIYGTTKMQVIPETVGQFTGLTDKNGKKIFEGDIVEFNKQVGEIVCERGAFGIGIEQGINYKRLEVYVEDKTYGFYHGVENDSFISLFEIYWNCNNKNNKIDEIEVIGNVHDNPELLEVEK